MRTLHKSDLNSVVGGVVIGDDPTGKSTKPQRMIGESLEAYNARLLEWYIAHGMA